MINPRLVLIGVVLAALLTIGGYLLGGALKRPNEATPTPEPSPAAAWLVTSFEPGTRYYFDLPVYTTFRVPAGWKYFDTEQGDSIVVSGAGTEAVGWILPDGVYQDPCHWLTAQVAASGLDVPSLVQALSSLPGVEATSPVATTIGGLSATMVTLTSTVDPSGCDQGQLHYFSIARGGQYGDQGVTQLYVTSVGTQPLVVEAWVSSADAGQPSDMRGILDSIAFPGAG